MEELQKLGLTPIEGKSKENLVGGRVTRSMSHIICIVQIQRSGDIYF